MRNSLFYSGVVIAAVIFGLLLSFYIGSSNATLATSNLPIQKELTSAPAPTVIPTQPLPTITPEVTPMSNDYCNPNSLSGGNFTDSSGFGCIFLQIVELINAVVPIMITIGLVGIILTIILTILPIIWNH